MPRLLKRKNILVLWAQILLKIFKNFAWKLMNGGFFSYCEPEICSISIKILSITICFDLLFQIFRYWLKWILKLKFIQTLNFFIANPIYCKQRNALSQRIV